MITFNPPLTISPPPFTDNSGNAIPLPPIIIHTLKVSYTDSPYLKTIIAKIENIPQHIVIIKGQAYDDLGDWTQKQIEDILLQILGPKPAEYLRSLFPPTIEDHPFGPGTMLSKMIKSLGITMNNNCSCKHHAIKMNTEGNDWCEQNIDTIVGWLRAEASKRKLPFIDSVGKIMVSRAIKKSRKLLANESVPDNDEDLDNV